MEVHANTPELQGKGTDVDMALPEVPVTPADRYRAPDVTPPSTPAVAFDEWHAFSKKTFALKSSLDTTQLLYWCRAQHVRTVSQRLLAHH